MTKEINGLYPSEPEEGRRSRIWAKIFGAAVGMFMTGSSVMGTVSANNNDVGLDQTWAVSKAPETPGATITETSIGTQHIIEIGGVSVSAVVVRTNLREIPKTSEENPRNVGSIVLGLCPWLGPARE